MSFGIILQCGKRLVTQTFIKGFGLETIGVHMRMAAAGVDGFILEQVHQAGAVSQVPQGFLDPQRGDVHPPVEAIGGNPAHHRILLVSYKDMNGFSQLDLPEVFNYVIPQSLDNGNLRILSSSELFGGTTDLNRKFLFFHRLNSPASS